MPSYDVPGVYIEEVTGPGVIAGVGTSTAAFVGPALAGPISEARRISSWDEFLSVYGVLQPNGSYLVYMATPKRFYLAHGVRSFFQNGGQTAYIVRIGTGDATTWEVTNQNGDVVVRLQAKQEGSAGDNLSVQLQRSTSASTADDIATATAVVKTNSSALSFEVDDAKKFRVGDIVTKVVDPESLDEQNRSAIANIDIVGNTLTLARQLTVSPAKGDSLRIASIKANQMTFRMAKTTWLAPGSVVSVDGYDAEDPKTKVRDYLLIQSIDQAGFVTTTKQPGPHAFNTAAAQPPTLTPQEFKLTITNPASTAPPETYDNLSLSPQHPGYVFALLASSNLVRVLPPLLPLTALGYPANLVSIPTAPGNLPIAVPGVNDNPGTLSANDYSIGLDILRDVEDVNLLCIPDAAPRGDCITIQQDMIQHCLLKRDRFAILDSQLGAPPTGPLSVEEQRKSVQSDSGFAALYYPWLVITDPLSIPTATNPIPATMMIPPSGAMAGVYARTDQAIGVHKAPANTDVSNVMGLETKLSDRQQGPLNLEGIDVLRIFPGTAQVMVWGARTTVNKDTTDWIYVNVRRLMIYIEQSLEAGIRWAVFEPNALPLWQKLKRTITEFLTRVWRDGALFGATAEQAFYVRIDEALNPPSTRALGRLYIEIGVAAVRPAEFIIVRIGLWDGGDQVIEN